MTYTDFLKSTKDLNTAITDLCEVVYDITSVADSLQREGRIYVEDSRELFLTVLQLAKDFEESFSSEDYEKDYLAEVWDFAERKLVEEYAPMKQYRVRVTRTYEFFVDAVSKDEAEALAEDHWFDHTNGVADSTDVEILDSYASPGME